MEQLISFAWLGLALILGRLLRGWIPTLRRAFIPSSIIGGLFLLLIGPEVLGRVAPGIPPLVTRESVAIWSTIPGFLINIVFAALFLGKVIPGLKEIWGKAGPQVAFSHTIAWGQYVVGFAVTAVLLVPLFGVEPMFGALIEIGFIGGHGTAAGLGQTFADLGWPQGQDLALGVATIGVLMGVLTGIVLVNWGVKRGYTRAVRTEAEAEEDIEAAGEEHDTTESEIAPHGQSDDPKSTVRIESMEPMTFHLAYIGASIGIGALLLRGLVLLESLLLEPLGAPELLAHVPLFPLAMVGGIIVQKIHSRFFPGDLDRVMILRLQGSALDLLIVSALASLTLSAIADAWLPLLILVVAGIAWTVACFVFFAPRMMRDFWFERGIGDFGQSLGVTATGLLLMRVVDPKSQTPAFEAFGYKQLLFEPLVGGGLFTAMSVPLVFAFGLVPMLVVCSVIMVIWIVIGMLLGRKHRSR